MANIGNQIKSLREKMGLSQSDFAAKLGLGGPTVISKYEKNQREPEIALLIKLANLGNVSLDWLLTGEGPQSREQNREEVIEDDEVIFKKVLGRLKTTIDSIKSISSEYNLKIDPNNQMSHIIDFAYGNRLNADQIRELLRLLCLTGAIKSKEP